MGGAPRRVGPDEPGGARYGPRVGAVAATLGVLLSLLLGVSRTALAMARQGELPRLLANVDAASATPRAASVAVAAVVIGVVALADVRGAIGFSSTCVLAYYAVANASAWTLGGTRLQRAQAGAGLLGCVVLAANLAIRSLLAGVAVLAVGVLVRRVAGRRSPRGLARSLTHEARIPTQAQACRRAVAHPGSRR